MIHFFFFCFCLTAGFTASSALRILGKRVDCSQRGLDSCRISNCSDKVTGVDRILAPNSPDFSPEPVKTGIDKCGLVPVMNVTWIIKPDASFQTLTGSQIIIVEERTNQSLCVQFSFNVQQAMNPDKSKWNFTLDEVEVEPKHNYTVTVFNLPEPHNRDNRIGKKINIPGCDDKRIQKAQMCLENGSLWDPHITVAVITDKKPTRLSIIVGFETAKYAEKYNISIQNGGFHYSENVTRENRTSVNVTFKFDWWQLSQCEMLITIQPFFIRCKSNCQRPNTTIDYCLYYPPRTYIIKFTVGLLLVGGCLAYLLWRTCHQDPQNATSSAAKEQPDVFQVQERKRVLIIYSLDHPLYKDIVLKFCAFLVTKCGTEVVLDLLDSTRLGVLGSIQWLEWHRKQIESSSDKILILCSPGVHAKWRAMCGDKQVFLREDARSPMGDMLTPSLSLMIPHFIRTASFKKYIVAYFDDVCSEEDIPSPFNITVRYKLMKQFEEVFFRILDTEKYEPGRVKQIEGLSESKYHQCPSGRALYDAIEAFHAYQQECPQWFEDELLESSELEVKEMSDEISENIRTVTNLITYCESHSAQVTSHVKTHEM